MGNATFYESQKCFTFFKAPFWTIVTINGHSALSCKSRTTRLPLISSFKPEQYALSKTWHQSVQTFFHHSFEWVFKLLPLNQKHYCIFFSSLMSWDGVNQGRFSIWHWSHCIVNKFKRTTVIFAILLSSKTLSDDVICGPWQQNTKLDKLWSDPAQHQSIYFCIHKNQ